MELSNKLMIVPDDIGFIDMQYPKLGFNSTNKCYLRSEVIDALILARDKFLILGYKLVIWDAWRSLNLQTKLYNHYLNNVIAEYHLENEDFEVQESVLSKFVSKPVKDELNPPLHCTGAAIDITLANRDGVLLNMGTKFDEFSEKSHTSCDLLSSEVIRNRKILLDVMEGVGFRNLHTEWWHFDLNVKNYKGIFNEEDIDLIL